MKENFDQTLEIAGAQNGASNTLDNDTAPTVVNEGSNGQAAKAAKPTTSARAAAFFEAALAYIKHARIELLIIVGAIVLDLVSKFLVDRFMPLHSREALIDRFLYFYYVHNYKAAFGSAFGLDKLLGEGGVRIFFIIFTTVALSLFGYFMYIFRHRSKLARFSLAMIIGGAIGNFYDRIVYGYVRDFVEIEYFGYNVPYLGYTFAIFNIADSFLTVGMIMLIFYLLFKYPKEDKKAKQECLVASKDDEEQGTDASIERKIGAKDCKAFEDGKQQGTD